VTQHPPAPPAPHRTWAAPADGPGASAAPRAAAPICIESSQLLGSAGEVHIDHRGVLYRLRQTSLGKLILTK
jgi:hemin uptake protein HemP